MLFCSCRQQQQRRGVTACHAMPALPHRGNRNRVHAAAVQSKAGAELIYRNPILLDACVNEMQRVGDSMMAKWAEVRLGLCSAPKRV